MSGSAFESAWASLKSDDPDRIEKIAPLAALAVPAAFGLAGALTGAGYRLYDDEGNFRPGRHAGATFQDPITGGLLAEREIEDPTGGQRALGAATGALQAVNPVAPLGRLGGSMRAARAARAATAGRQASRMADASRAARRSGDVMAGSIDEAARVRAAAARQLQNRTMAERGLSSFNTRAARMAGRLPQIAGLAEEQGLGAAAAGFGMNWLMNQQGQQMPAMGSQPQSFGAGSAMGAGAGNLANVQGNATADRVIFDPTLAQGNQALTGFEGQQEFGGFGVRTGEDMYIGDQLLKEVNARMHEMHLTKAKCPGCGKADCVGKMGCVGKAEKCPHCDGDAPRSECVCGKTNKADKKPAHGMVIVIGSKAGPGPMTEGKRDKLDSEKDSKKDD